MPYWPWLSLLRQPELQRERTVPDSQQLRPFIPLSAGLISLHAPWDAALPPSLYIILAKRGWEEGMWGGKAATCPCLACTCTHIHTDVGAMRPLPPPIPICCPALLPLLPEMLPGCSRSERSARLRFFSTCFPPCRGAEKGREEGRHGEKLRADRARQPALIHTGPQCIAPPLLTPLPPIWYFHSLTEKKKVSYFGKAKWWSPY